MAFFTEPGIPRPGDAEGTDNIVVERDPGTACTSATFVAGQARTAKAERWTSCKVTCSRFLECFLEDGEPRLESEFVGVQTIQVA